MSKLNDLINELCPDGVEFVKLGNECEIKTGKGITQKDCSESDVYPVYSGGKDPMGFYKEYNRSENTVTISRVGAYAGFVNYVASKFYLNDKCFSVIPNRGNINSKYLYYKLKSIERNIIKLQSEGGVPTINTKKVGGIEIPLPPLPIQEEIVRILDNFTQLEAELEAELDCRKRQYEYYRNQLLTFDKNTPPEKVRIEWKNITEVFEIKNGYTPSKSKPEYWEGGTIPWFRMEDIRMNGRILSDSILHITSAGVKKGKLFESGSFILATTATIGEHALLIADSLANQRFTNLKIRESYKSLISTKFMYFYMFQIDEWCKSHTNVSGFASVDMAKFKKLEVPIPPIAEQNRIVSILDRFEALTTDLQKGIPAEIAARRQQYEHYRDKLLSFKRKTV